jgi:hypothetical protein
MLYAANCDFTADDVEEWMWERAATRAGYYRIEIPLIRRRTDHCHSGVEWEGEDEIVIKRSVNLSQKEYALLDKVVSNQIFAESKMKVFRTVVYQRNLQLWDDGTEDAVTMRVLAPWAMAYYKCQPHKFWMHGLMKYTTFLWKVFKWFGRRFACMTLGWLIKINKGKFPGLYSTEYFRASLSRIGITDGTVVQDQPPAPKTEASVSSSCDADDDAHDKSPKNKLGYQQAGASYVNEHPGGGKDDQDSEIRATVEGRIIRKDCGVGVVGQTTDDTGRKQVCGVLSQPISVEPNVYAQEVLNAIKAIEERINKKQRPYAGSEADELKIKRMVYQSIHGKRNSPFSAKKVLDLIHTLVYDEIKSNKWTESRVADAIEGLCREIDPQFKLKAAVKLEAMPEEKAPRLLIADEDRGQVMALMTIYCIETLIKKHFPEKGIKGLPKKDAIKRVMKACRVPRKVAKKMVTIFEGDGTAWDTTCSARIRELVENPVINHVANLVNGFMYATPSTWAEAHASVCAQEKLDISYTKNKEYQKITIDAIRRSGHRGTSCLNWWMNFVCWHCAIFEDPELFLDPTHRHGKDVTGVNRWLNSAFEGDDSFLATAPQIEVGKSLHMKILQFWERIGFNMKIEIRKERALFVGYYIGLDDSGPLFDEKKDEWMMVPEVDRCFSRAGTSCSPSMIEAFNANDRSKCVRLAGSAAMSRAFEFAGLAPTISNKFLQYAVDCDFEITHDLKMRTNQEFDDKSELVEHIRALNAMCQSEDKILTSTGFWSSDQEKNRFVDFTWDYDQLVDWEGFRNSLPQSWRQ